MIMGTTSIFISVYYPMSIALSNSSMATANLNECIQPDAHARRCEDKEMINAERDGKRRSRIANKG